MAYSEFIRRPAPGARWLADMRGTACPEVVLGPVTVIIGPEGGLTDSEREAALSVGWMALTLGRNVLRFETAAVAAAARVAAARSGAQT